MKTGPIVPARVEGIEAGAPYSPDYQDRYRPQAGAPAQARHVFLAGNQLPARWQGRARFVVLETGFGLGNNFLATWDTWRNDAQRCESLYFISIEQHPLVRSDLARAHADSTFRDLAEQLLQAWPPLTHNLHTLAFERGRVRLLLAMGDVAAWLPELSATVDAFYLDGFAPAKNPRMWDERVCKALGRLAAPGATLATWTAAHALRADLRTAGFEVQLGAGTGGKRDITLARFAPRFEPRRPAGRGPANTAPERHALVIGAGLAGCATACALAEQGWRSTLLERREGLAEEGSGNPAGMFHGIVNAQDGLHARFNRAAALASNRAVRLALKHHGVRGDAEGLLRLETTLLHAQMLEMLRELGLPPDYVQALSFEEAGARAGLRLQHPAWFYPGGGWVQPTGLARAFFDRAAPHAALCAGVEVRTLRHEAGHWLALDAQGVVMADAPCVVLANAGDALRLLGSPDWPIEKLRGQISIAQASMLMTADSAASPLLPVAGSGYLLPEIDGQSMFGATAQRGDDDPGVRIADHAANVAQLSRLMGRTIDVDPATLGGRTGWRWASRDRLPVIGAVPSMVGVAPLAGPVPPRRADQPRFVPRVPGLFVCVGLGSRGITWSALGGQVVAAAITGAPAPLESSLLDAVDPARFVSRQVRRSGTT